MKILVHNYYNNTANFADSLQRSPFDFRENLQLAKKIVPSKLTQGCTAEIFSLGGEPLLALSLGKDWDEAERISYMAALNSALMAKGMRVDAVSCSHSDCTGGVNFANFFNEVKKINRGIATFELTSDATLSAAEHTVAPDAFGDTLVQILKPAAKTPPFGKAGMLIDTFVDCCSAAAAQVAQQRTP